MGELLEGWGRACPALCCLGLVFFPVARLHLLLASLRFFLLSSSPRFFFISPSFPPLPSVFQCRCLSCAHARKSLWEPCYGLLFDSVVVG